MKGEEQMKKVFLVDFDGTVTKKDTVYIMVEKFAKEGWQYYNELWEKGEMSTEECAIETLKLMEVSEEELFKFIMENVEIDDHFLEFLGVTKEKGYEVVIVSDGYDFIIEAVMKKYNLKLPYYSNKMWFEGGKIKVAFPYKDKECDKCGMCKLNILKEYRKKGYSVAFVGDGYSDFCVVEHADEVFAKDVLADYCEEKGIKYFRFGSFKDIIRYVKR